MINNLRETRASYFNMLDAICSWRDNFKIMLTEFFKTHNCNNIDIMDGNIKWMDDNGEVYSLNYVEVRKIGIVTIKAKHCFSDNEINLGFYEIPTAMQKQVFDAVIDTMEALDK